MTAFVGHENREEHLSTLRRDLFSLFLEAGKDVEGVGELRSGNQSGRTSQKKRQENTDWS